MSPIKGDTDLVPTPWKYNTSLHFLHTSGSKVRCGMLHGYDEAIIRILYTMSSGKDEKDLTLPSLNSLDQANTPILSFKASACRSKSLWAGGPTSASGTPEQAKH